VLIDCDISAGGTYCQITDYDVGVITFNALFYKGVYLDLSAAPPEFRKLQLVIDAAVTGRISVSFFGLLEDLNG
jgi:hypothetical protein